MTATVTMVARLRAALSHSPRNIVRKVRWRLWRWLKRRALRTQFALLGNRKLSLLPKLDCSTSLLVPATTARTLFERHAEITESSLRRLLPQANAIIEGRVYVHGHGYVDLPQSLETRPEIKRLIERHDFLIPLVQAWFHTNEQRYKDAAIREIRRWLRAFPRNRVPHGQKPTDVAFRLLNWLWVFQYVGLPPDENDIARLQDAILNQLLYLRAELSPGGNHLVIESLALFIYGAILKQDQYCRKFLKHGQRLLESEIVRQVMEDGVHSEQSMFYHQVTATHFLKALIVAERNGIELQQRFHERLRAMLNYVHGSMKDGGTNPMVGDGDRLDTIDREHYEAGLLLAARNVLFGQEIFTRFAHAINDASIWFLGRSPVDVATSSKSPESIAFPVSGIAVLRNANDYVFFNAGPFGDEEYPHHGHADALSVELVLNGRPVLIDPGGYGYRDDEFRHYFRGTGAHSTVLVDGKDQSELFEIIGYGRRATATLEDFERCDRYDLAQGSHDGYSPTVHRRQVFLRKGSMPYVVLVDSLLGHGGHTVTQNLVLPPGCRFDVEQSLVTYESDNEAGIKISVLGDSVSSRPAVHIGQTSPLAIGWTSYTTHELSPSTVLRYTFSVKLPVCMVTLLHDQTVDISANQENETISISGTNDRIVLSNSTGQARFMLNIAGS